MLTLLQLTQHKPKCHPLFPNRRSGSARASSLRVYDRSLQNIVLPQQVQRRMAKRSTGKTFDASIMPYNVSPIRYSPSLEGHTRPPWKRKCSARNPCACPVPLFKRSPTRSLRFLILPLQLFGALTRPPILCGKRSQLASGFSCPAPFSGLSSQIRWGWVRVGEGGSSGGRPEATTLPGSTSPRMGLVPTWPPSSPEPSNSVTSWPRSAHPVAAASPAGPDPTTATRFLLSAGTGSRLRVVSYPARGFTRQEACYGRAGEGELAGGVHVLSDRRY